MKLRDVFASVFCLAAALIALGGAGLYLGSSKAQAQPGAESAAVTANSANGPDIVRLVGPVCVNTDVRDLPYIPSTPQIQKRPLTGYTPATIGAPMTETSPLAKFQALLTGILRPVPMMPLPLLTFEGTSSLEGGRESPPDTNGDVGPNHYV
jgi:hypothetical protein